MEDEIRLFEIIVNNRIGGISNCLVVDFSSDGGALVCCNWPADRIIIGYLEHVEYQARVYIFHKDSMITFYCFASDEEFPRAKALQLDGGRDALFCYPDRKS